MPDDIERVWSILRAGLPHAEYLRVRQIIEALASRAVEGEKACLQCGRTTCEGTGGASLRAAGYVCEGEAGGSGAMWGTREGRAQDRIGDDMLGGKLRWRAIITHPTTRGGE